ncbi:MAG: DNA repair protein RecO [Candidatus Omnitrophica bacterium]|nr:DNA repair protein RecO [Candidatus Omnitrophota bacterium]
MAIRRDEVFVLKRIPLRETSLVVTVFGREGGKFKVLAKGVRKEKNPLTARFEPFTHLSMVYYEKLKSDVHLVSEAAILNSNAPLRERLDRFTYASYMTELIEVLFGAHDPNPEAFDLLSQALRLLYDTLPNRVACAFQFKAFEIAGLVPLLNACANCGTTSLNKTFFSSRQGGVICRSCEHGAGGAIPISKGTVRTLMFFLKSGLEQAVKVELGPQTQGELERIGNRFLAFRLEHPLRSAHFLTELKPILKSS